ncbi:hypothetical protein HDU85_007785 [Gaertneriomyces sp. JEL0708]|nr:hypothetical protein HDU85_007785 [Gaertneriomyces sp. JEL0708]
MGTSKAVITKSSPLSGTKRKLSPGSPHMRSPAFSYGSFQVKQEPEETYSLLDPSPTSQQAQSEQPSKKPNFNGMRIQEDPHVAELKMELKNARMDLLSHKNACLKAKLDGEQARSQLVEKDRIILELQEELRNARADFQSRTRDFQAQLLHLDSKVKAANEARIKKERQVTELVALLNRATLERSTPHTAQAIINSAATQSLHSTMGRRQPDAGSRDPSDDPNASAIIPVDEDILRQVEEQKRLEAMLKVEVPPEALAEVTKQPGIQEDFPVDTSDAQPVLQPAPSRGQRPKPVIGNGLLTAGTPTKVIDKSNDIESKQVSIKRSLSSEPEFIPQARSQNNAQSSTSRPLVAFRCFSAAVSVPFLLEVTIKGMLSIIPVSRHRHPIHFAAVSAGIHGPLHYSESYRATPPLQNQRSPLPFREGGTPSAGPHIPRTTPARSVPAIKIGLPARPMPITPPVILPETSFVRSSGETTLCKANAALHVIDTMRRIQIKECDLGTVAVKAVLDASHSRSRLGKCRDVPAVKLPAHSFTEVMYDDWTDNRVINLTLDPIVSTAIDGSDVYVSANESLRPIIFVISMESVQAAQELFLAMQRPVLGSADKSRALLQGVDQFRRSLGATSPMMTLNEKQPPMRSAYYESHPRLIASPSPLHESWMAAQARPRILSYADTPMFSQPYGA